MFGNMTRKNRIRLELIRLVGVEPDEVELAERYINGDDRALDKLVYIKCRKKGMDPRPPFDGPEEVFL